MPNRLEGEGEMVKELLGIGKCSICGCKEMAIYEITQLEPRIHIQLCAIHLKLVRKVQ